MQNSMDFHKQAQPAHHGKSVGIPADFVEKVPGASNDKQAQIQQINLKCANEVQLQENVSPNAIARHKYDQGPFPGLGDLLPDEHNRMPFSNRDLPSLLDDSADHYNQAVRNQPNDFQRPNESFTMADGFLDETPGLLKEDDDTEIIRAHRVPFASNHRGLENPEEKVRTPMASKNFILQQTPSPPEQRSHETPSSDGLRCSEQCLAIAAPSSIEAKMPAPSMGPLQAQKATSIFEVPRQQQEIEELHPPVSPDFFPRQPILTRVKTQDPKMHALMPKLGDIDQDKREDAFFSGLPAEPENDSAVFGSGGRNDLIKIQMGSRTSQLHLSPQVHRNSGYCKRKTYLSRREPVEHDMIVVNDRSPHLENSVDERYRNQRGQMVVEPMNDSPFAPTRQSKRMSPHKHINTTPEQHMSNRSNKSRPNTQIKQLDKNTYLEFNVKVNILSLSHKRSRDESSRRSRSDRRSVAAAHDVRNFTSSKKRHRRIQVEDVSPVKSFPISGIREEASPEAPMVAESQMSSSLKKQRPQGQMCWMPGAGSIPFPFEFGHFQGRGTPPKENYPKMLPSTLTGPDIEAWQMAIFKSQQQAMAAGLQMYHQYHTGRGMTNKNSSTSHSQFTGSKANVRNTTEKSASKKSKSSESDDEDSEDSSEMMPMHYPYAPMFSPWLYPFMAASQNLTPLEFQQVNGAFLMPGQSSSQSSRQMMGDKDEIISEPSPDKLTRSAKNGKSFEKARGERTTSGKQMNSVVTPSEANTTSKGNFAGIECSPAHTGRMYGRQNMPTSAAADVSQNSLSQEDQFVVPPKPFVIPANLQSNVPYGYMMAPVPIPHGNWSQGAYPNMAVDPQHLKTGTFGENQMQSMNFQENLQPENIEVDEGNNSTKKAIKRAQAEEDTPIIQEQVQQADSTTASKAEQSTKKKRVNKAARKDNQQTPTKNTPIIQPMDESTFDRPDDVNRSTNQKISKRVTKNMFPITPPKADLMMPNTAERVLHPRSSLLPSDDVPMSNFDSQIDSVPDQFLPQPQFSEQNLWPEQEMPMQDDLVEEPPKKRRRTKKDDSSLGQNKKMTSQQREDVSKINERKLEDQLDFVMSQTLSQEKLFAKIEAGEPTVTKCKGCKCRKGFCLKRYCECLRNNATCGPDCNCTKYATCKNMPGAQYSKVRRDAIMEILKRKFDAFEPKIDGGNHSTGCNCKNSKCQKAYCECFERGVLCSDKCKCIDCKNNDHDHSHKKEPQPQEEKAELPFVVNRQIKAEPRDAPIELLQQQDPSTILSFNEPEPVSDLECLEVIEEKREIPKKKQKALEEVLEKTEEPLIEVQPAKPVLVADKVETKSEVVTTTKKKRKPVFEKVITRSMRKKAD